MKTKEQIKEWLLENTVDRFGEIDLSEIDFGDIVINLRHVKAKRIYNSYQKANAIWNGCQEAEHIFNDEQKAQNVSNAAQESYRISNNAQEACYINNLWQKIKSDYSRMSKEELIQELEKRDRE